MVSIALYALGMGLLFAELFVPGGLLGMLGVGLVLYALVATWSSADTAAGPLTLVTLVALPLMLRFAGRRLSLTSRRGLRTALPLP